MLVDPGVSATAEAGVVTGAVGDPADDVPPDGGNWVAGAGDGDGCSAVGVTVEVLRGGVGVAGGRAGVPAGEDTGVTGTGVGVAGAGAVHTASKARAGGGGTRPGWPFDQAQPCISPSRTRWARYPSAEYCQAVAPAARVQNDQ